MKPPQIVVRIVAVASSIALAGGYIAYRASRTPAADDAAPDALGVGDVTNVSIAADSPPREIMSSSKSMVVDFPSGGADARQPSIEFSPDSQPAPQARKQQPPRRREVMAGTKFGEIIDPIPPSPTTKPTTQPVVSQPPKPPPTSSAPSQPQSATPDS